ncbi:hypothetical protein KIH74_11510 [Kineosporia sp. J2-2]|uniref:Uncharacterized protein n=1 Tax=Kineosporia corallincola TaxID=2835133 RepID=A0ABS5TEP0_9ACTN|nr:hypothetical protein [Kineosporia corallincola]MBT0769552.1 hypothetical protein [Kineosporia corallincola]
MTSRYPIISHHELQPGETVGRPRPGRALVLHLADGRHLLAGSGPVPADAAVRAVTEVDVRTDVPLAVRARLKERRLSLGVPLRAEFRCTVFDPVAVAETRRTLAVTDLHGHLSTSVTTIARATRRGPGYDDRLRHLLQTRLNPPPGRHAVPGMRIDVSRAGSGFDDRPVGNGARLTDHGYTAVDTSWHHTHDAGHSDSGSSGGGY